MFRSPSLHTIAWKAIHRLQKYWKVVTFICLPWPAKWNPTVLQDRHLTSQYWRISQFKNGSVLCGRVTVHKNYFYPWEQPADVKDSRWIHCKQNNKMKKTGGYTICRLFALCCFSIYAKSAHSCGDFGHDFFFFSQKLEYHNQKRFVLCIYTPRK